MPEKRPQRTVLDRLIFPEGLRWHDGRLWFCDIETHEIISAAPDGTVAQRLRIDGEHTIGLSWTPDGELTAGGRFQRLFRFVDGSAELIADLREEGDDAWSNDIVIDRAGRLYLASFGMAYDLTDHAANERRLKGAGGILLRTTDGNVRQVAHGLSMPNTMQLTPDGRTLICSDSLANRVVKYHIEPDGSLGDAEVFAELECMPDGSTMDAEGALWIAVPPAGQVRRIFDGGRVAEVIDFGQEVFDVTLGGRDRKTLFAGLSTLAATSEASADGAERSRPGSIRAVEVDVPAP